MTTETAREAVARAIGEVFDDLSADAAAQRMIENYHAWLGAHGWQIVPKEPTPEMNTTIRCHGVDLRDGTMKPVCGLFLGETCDRIYRAMLAAAPKPPGE